MRITETKINGIQNPMGFTYDFLLCSWKVEDTESKKQVHAKIEVSEDADFKSFCAIGAQVRSTVRTIYDCEVERKDDIITIRVTGNGFLYNMVRIIAGTLIRVGGGEWEPEHMTEILAACDRGAAGPTAPAHGLTMMGIVYEEQE